MPPNHQPSTINPGTWSKNERDWAMSCLSLAWMFTYLLLMIAGVIPSFTVEWSDCAVKPNVWPTIGSLIMLFVSYFVCFVYAIYDEINKSVMFLQALFIPITGVIYLCNCCCSNLELPKRFEAMLVRWTRTIARFVDLDVFTNVLAMLTYLVNAIYHSLVYHPTINTQLATYTNCRDAANDETKRQALESAVTCIQSKRVFSIMYSFSLGLTIGLFICFVFGAMVRATRANVHRLGQR